MLRRNRLGPTRYEPYVALLAQLASREQPPAVPRQVRSPDLFVEAALFHGVTGQVLAGVHQERVSLPAGSIAAIEGPHARNMVTAAMLRAELLSVGPVIAAACGTPAVLVKGPAVADRYYADQELRPFADLDFVLPADRVGAAAAALCDAFGYSIVPLPWPRNHARHAHAVELSRRVGVHALGLELHWRISDDPRAAGLDHARLAAAGKGGTAAPDVTLPGCGEQLVVLAVHLVHHWQKRLIWLIDLAALGNAATEDQWRAAFELVDALGLGWVLHATLDLAGRHLGFSRRRPPSESRPSGWGPLRAAHTIGGPVGYHAGHLATLGWPERAGYLVAGAQSRARGARARARRGSGRLTGED